jgi:hypothetical protein
VWVLGVVRGGNQDGWQGDVFVVFTFRVLSTARFFLVFLVATLLSRLVTARTIIGSPERSY